MSAGLSGTFARVALTSLEIARLTTQQLAVHIIGLGAPPQMILAAILDFMHDKPDLRMDLFRHIGLLREDPPPADPSSETSHASRGT